VARATVVEEAPGEEQAITARRVPEGHPLARFCAVRWGLAGIQAGVTSCANVPSIAQVLRWFGHSSAALPLRGSKLLKLLLLGSQFFYAAPHDREILRHDLKLLR
jgi:hypothetical protein